ncbi:hypothetical protein B7494_g813 [Chlorociboria aeruginascens]|nr:hypothetical protein B7494_g813 [Chlorociboria aeruginascens]
MDSRSMTLAEDDKSVTPSPRPSFQKETKTEKDIGNNSLTDNERETQKDEQAVENGGPIAEEQDDSGEYPDATRMVFIVVALVLSIFLVSLDLTIVATAIPKITDEFQGLDLVGWYGSAFFLTVGSFQSTWGKAYKYFPLKTTFLITIFVFELGSLICGVAPNSTALIVGRAIAGLGGAGITSGAYTIIAFAARPRQRAAFTGLLGGSYGIASVIGPLLGGVFAEKVTWRWCFYINLPIGGLAAAIIFLCFTTPSQAVPVRASIIEKILQMDLPGTFTVMGAIICYILALQYGGQRDKWSDSTVIGTLVGFVVIMIAFGVVEYFQGERAMVVGRLLKERTVAVAMLFVFFIGGGFFILLYYIPIYFQYVSLFLYVASLTDSRVVDGVTASQSGIRNLPLILGVTISTIISGGLISAYGIFVPYLFAGATLGTIGCGLIYTLSTTSSSSQWIGYQALAGLGIGFAFQIPVISGQAVVDPSDLASATAMILFSQTIGGAFFVSAGQSAFTNILLQKLPITAPTVDPQAVAATGITDLRAHYQGQDLIGIINAYMSGLKVAYAIAIASTGIAFFVAFGSKWRNLKGKQIGTVEGDSIRNPKSDAAMDSHSQPSPPIVCSSMASDIVIIKHAKSAIPYLKRETQNAHTMQQILELERKCILALQVQPSSDLFKSLSYDIGPLKCRIEDCISRAPEAKMQYQRMRAQRYLCKYGTEIDETICASVGLTKGSQNDRFLEKDWLYLINDDQWRRNLGQSQEERYTRPLMATAIEAAKVCGDSDIEEMILEIEAHCSGSQAYNGKSFDELKGLTQYSQIAEILVKDYHNVEKYLSFIDNPRHKKALAIYIKMGVRKFQARTFRCIEETFDEKKGKWKISYYDIIPFLRRAEAQKKVKGGKVDVLSKKDKNLLEDCLGIHIKSKAKKTTRLKKKRSKRTKAKTSQSTKTSKTSEENLSSSDRLASPDRNLGSDSGIDVSGDDASSDEAAPSEEVIGETLRLAQTW